ncbi:MAG: hypothetical protein IKS27_03120 [Oscillospiraceae bacterium]|nr:hypothetical protein [Oscillospiraceae bacterium]
MALQAKRYSVSTYLKFFLFSAFGVFAFFINFNLPAYQIHIGGWEWGLVKAQSNVLCSHLTNFIKAALYTGNFKAMPFVVWAIGLYAVVDLFWLRPEKAWHTTKVNAAFAIFKIIGFIVLTMIDIDIYFGAHFGFMGWLFNGVDSLNGNSIANFVMANILVTICISIPCASLFLPFLVDYGLVDFIGVFVRVIMRPVFKLPGRAAIIMVTAFLGNFSAGHIAVNDQYKTGRMTERESVCIDTSLSTVSVGFLMALATNTGLNNAELWGGKNYWNLFFWVAFLITLIVAFIGVRIPPLRGIPDNYYPGATPNPEQVIKKGIFSAAITEGLDMAQNQDNVGKRIKYYMIETMNVLGTVAAGTSFFGTFGVVLYTYTPIVRWLGYIFWPFFRIFGFKGQELTTATTGAMISFVEVTVPGLLVTTGVWSMRLRFMLAVLPVTSIIFLASFVPCCMGTEVPVKFWHLCVIWLERMILSIIITGIFAIILFPATMIA